MTPIQLNTKNFAALPTSVHLPQYRREEVRTGIVHIGIGGFHRAHQAYAIDRLLELGTATEWGICGIALRESDRSIYEALSHQDGLYTLLIPDSKGNFSARVIASIVELLYAPQDPEAAIRRMADNTVRLITLTITEGGYNFTHDGTFDWNNTDILWDLKNPEKPKTVFGYLYAALKLRKAKGLGGITIQSCDNMEHNGKVTRNMLYAFINRKDPQMITWMDDHVTFPDSMVDRITPATTEHLKTILAEDIGLLDAWPVICEPFFQWIIQDDYAAGRPQWEQIGAQLVADVTPYEKMKIRLLNGGHTLLGMAGYLAGYRYIHESMADQEIEGLLRRYMDLEVTPTLHSVPGIDLEGYKDTLVQRFKNPFIRDEVARIISGSSDKFPKFILPVILDRIRKHQPVSIAALVTACWYRYLRLNLPTPQHVQDGMADALLQSVDRAEKLQDPLLFLDHAEVFGDIKGHSAFTDSFLSHIQVLSSTGLKQLIETELNQVDEKN